ncbi:MAG: hypothetical protein J7M34_03635, partial [Anaerolineae bacterium]|nr:hypothetical protein [Anaerolineae bacterium]
TTLVKLAGYYTQKQHKRVLLASIDTHRVGAIAQLQAYGDIMGVPVEIAYSPDELADIVRTHDGWDLILVDTPGRSRRDGAWPGDLRSFASAVPSPEIYLAVSCTMAYLEMEEVVQRFSVVPLSGLILTKADETERMGAAISLSYHTGLPLAYVTTGQQVPEDIELASAERLACRMTRGVQEYVISRMDVESSRPMSLQSAGMAQ